MKGFLLNKIYSQELKSQYGFLERITLPTKVEITSLSTLISWKIIFATTQLCCKIICFVIVWASALTPALSWGCIHALIYSNWFNSCCWCVSFLNWNLFVEWQLRRFSFVQRWIIFFPECEAKVDISVFVVDMQCLRGLDCNPCLTCSFSHDSGT